ncbi:MAG: sigma-54-dependent Fis family transcriptional regulator [candidate division Zixibacteria bacterium]|nr:sigma-54-dependent Fis family transcriptional regulator [candidate division Zixibacteria bacterium]
MINIIVVDDDKALRKNLAFYLKSQSYEVDTAESGEEAIELSKNKFYDILISDIKMNKMSGFELMKKVKNIHPAAEIILITGYGNIPMAVDAIQGGAADFICKPFEFGNLLTRIESIIKRREHKVTSTDKYDKLITKSQKMQDVLNLAAKASGTEVAVLIEGESGTGKELIARAIHGRSNRKDFPFKIVECSTMNEKDLQAELFGNWEDNDYAGMIVQANNGTLFIKDIELLSANLQASFLRYIQDGFYTIPSKNQKIKSDVRIICSCTKSLRKIASAHQFREDLFYAINIMSIYTPPLRNRIADIFPLVNHFLEKYSAKFNKNVKAIAPDILAWMQTYQWPGNVAELENSIARACALSNSEIIDESLIFTLPRDRPVSEEEQGFLNITLKDNQKALILKALKQNTGNYTRTAQQLGISRTTLWRRMKKFKIEEKLIT